MARKSKLKAYMSPSIEAAPMTAEMKKREEQYRLEDDARTIRNYLDLKKESERHSRAIAHMRSQTDDLDALEGRKSRKMTRKSSRGARR